MVAKPVGIRTVLSSVPLWTGHDGGDPRRYFKLGRFTMGNTDGFQFSHGIEYGQQLLYPMPTVWELLAYDIKNGASCLFQELVDVPDLTLKQPWDRAPVVWLQAATPTTAGGEGSITRWTYTVAAGRRLMLSNVRLTLIRNTAATTASGVAGYVTVNGTVIANSTMLTNVVGAVLAEGLSAGPLYLKAGDVVAGVTFNFDTGGAVSAYVLASGLLFDS